MLKRFASVTGMGLALLLSAAGGSQAGAKPPDLPVEIEHEFLPVVEPAFEQSEPPIVETDGREYIIEVQTQVPVIYHCVPNGNSFSCVDVPQYFWNEVVNVLQGNSISQPTGPMPVALPAMAPMAFPVPGPNSPGLFGDAVQGLQQLGEARKLYENAEHHLQMGDLPAAHHFYQETHLRSPNSRYGQVAREKLSQIERQLVPGAIALQKGPVAQSNPVAATLPAPAAECKRAETAGERFLQKLAQAQNMYHIAESCRRRGDLDKAYTCYHEAQRLCPNSDYAQMANEEIRRIDALRQVRDESEITEVPASSSSDQSGEVSWLPISWIVEGIDPASSATQSTAPVRSGRLYKPTATNGHGTEECESSHSSCYRLRSLTIPVPEETPAEESEAIPVPMDVEFSDVLMQVLSALGGNTHLEVDVDTNHEGNLRLLGGIYFGAVGCRMTVDSNNFSVTFPTIRGMR